MAFPLGGVVVAVGVSWLLSMQLIAYQAINCPRCALR
jgi:hypothetical protein